MKTMVTIYHLTKIQQKLYLAILISMLHFCTMPGQLSGTHTITSVNKDIKGELRELAKLAIGVNEFLENSDFTLLDTNLEGLSRGVIKWGDYDNDGDLDLLQTGWIGDTDQFRTRIINNTGNGFEDSGILLQGLSGNSSCSADWIDIDSDNDLDIIATGRLDGDELNKKTVLYNNNAGVFTLVEEAEIPDVSSSCVKWADMDRNGTYDLLLSGRSNTGDYNKIYLNSGESFTASSFFLQPTQGGENSLVDIDNDGDVDIFSCGSNHNPSVFYINNGDMTFTVKETEIPELGNASVDWSDLDNDGDMDVAVMGKMEADPVLKIYRNDGMPENNEIWFSQVDQFTGTESGDLAWADYDNDGDVDLAVTGNHAGYQPSTAILINDQGNFTEAGYNLVPLGQSALDWGDFDNDGDLDLAIQGYKDGETMTIIYRNERETMNTRPEAPSGLQGSMNGDSLILQWNPGQDVETPSNNLFYNVRITREAQSFPVLSSMSEAGFLKKTFHGNAGDHNSLTLINQPEGTYFWSVQTIDQGFAASGFSTEEQIVITNISTEDNLKGISIFPNPVKEKIWIRTRKPDSFNLRIFDLSGFEVLSRRLMLNMEDHSLDLNNLSPGIYILEIRKDNQLHVEKLVVY